MFDPVGGPEFANLARATAAGGTLVLYGALDPRPTIVPPFEILARDLTIRGLALTRDDAQLAALKQFVRSGLTGTPLEPQAGDGMLRHFRPIFKGTLIANVQMDAQRGNRLIDAGLADLIAFGRPFIANPDLVERLSTGAPLAEPDWTTVYASGSHGYSDYPTLQPAHP